MKRISVFHSRLGAAALAAALHYSYGAAGQAELLPALRRLQAIKKQPRGFVSADEALLVVADGERHTVLQRAINNVVGRFRPDLEIVYYSMHEHSSRWVRFALWWLSRGLLPGRLATYVSQVVWNGMR